MISVWSIWFLETHTPSPYLYELGFYIKDTFKDLCLRDTIDGSLVLMLPLVITINSLYVRSTLYPLEVSLI